MHASESVFSLSDPEQRMVGVECNVAGEYQEADKPRVLLDQAMSWTEERNLYPGPSLIALRDYKKGRALPNGYFCPDLDQWGRFWGIAATKSTQGAARFQDGDLLAKLQADIHAVAPADFRLAMEVAVIQSLARRLTAILLTRDPLSENVHLKAPAVALFGLAGVANGAFQRMGRALAPLARSYRA